MRLAAFMTCRRVTISAVVALYLVAPPALHAAEPATTGSVTSPAATQPAIDGVSLAVLDFNCTAPGNPELGKQISEVLTATLSGEPGVLIVDRSSMDKILQEHQLNLAGAVDSAKALSAGKLVGAKLIITGMAFPSGKEIFITARVIGTETSLFDGTLVRGPKTGDMSDLIMQLSQKIAEKLRIASPRLLANNGLIDPLPALNKKLAGRKLPIVCVNIVEHHLNADNVAPIDPAAETEVKNVLIAAGFTVIDGQEEAKLDKARVEVAITGDAFSEPNAKIGNLVSCTGRIELKATDRKGHGLLFSDRTTTRAVDLAENVAGKTALQKAGHDMAVKLLEHFAETTPPAPATQPG